MRKYYINYISKNLIKEKKNFNFYLRKFVKNLGEKNRILRYIFFFSKIYISFLVANIERINFIIINFGEKIGSTVIYRADIIISAIIVNKYFNKYLNKFFRLIL